MISTTQGAMPANPTTDARLYFSAINGLSHALHLLTHGELERAQLQRAIGKATRAATAIKRLAELNLSEG